MSRAIDADALFREMEKAQWYNNADRDEIAEELVLNAPTIEPERKKGRWIKENACEFCGFQPWFERDIHTLSFCPNCGADMRTPVETARDIVHEAIDNSVWSDTVDVAVMHKIVDEYNEMRGEANADVKS
jgi:predicted Zn-ribbon and HTH transcriptional regulator